jgi:hypothetical protein
MSAIGLEAKCLKRLVEKLEKAGFPTTVGMGPPLEGDVDDAKLLGVGRFPL